MKIAILFALVISLAFACDSPLGKQNNTVPDVQKHIPNTLINKRFKTERLFGLTTEKFDHWLSNAEEVGRWVGNTIKFTDTVHFVSAYEAWCGNDCFTSVYGRYYFVDSLKVRFYTDSITRWGECEGPTEYIKSRPALDLYLVKGADGSLQLKQKPNPF
jgi:hypothetical protein